MMAMKPARRKFNLVTLDYDDLDHAPYDRAVIQHGAMKDDIYVGELRAGF